MKSIIKSILKEEREKKSLNSAILKDLNKTFNSKTIGNRVEYQITDVDKLFGTFSGLQRILGNLIVDHLENVYGFNIVEERETVIPIITQWMRENYTKPYPFPGDVIEMVEMPDDPNPIEPGTKGVVRRINTQYFGGQPEEHLQIRWENGRTLKVILPHDKIKIVSKTKSIPSDVLGFGYSDFQNPWINENEVDRFIDFAKRKLELDDDFSVVITDNDDELETLASYDINDNEVKVLGKNRSLPDIIRSVAHELVHHKQNERGELTGREEEGADGSPWEDQANALAGELVRKYGRENPEIYDI